ncbi:efflux RND transporter periplasmic adaptor subunit [Halopseudomonas salegens]|uniref:Membrane fusion protein, multidrug efflux system n=1 Tax=Halopseudomonas salegens TaxID=1434072 RepID=A0A1H2DWN4_9GAMM|nr:efflux RND transporter periplasmic adaptor subunit [Halopseudomonas salegens]SDT87214.1 membrane fusion protein, multidrug efflux system [Halopseudomonas salegens]
MTDSRKPSFLRQITPIRLAIIMAIVLALWLLLGEKRSAQEKAPVAEEQTEQTLSRVETRWFQAESLPREQVLQGQLQPWQSVRVMAQVSGRVEKLTRQQGDRVSDGDVLLELSDEGRSQSLAQARAILRLRQKELDSARQLRASSFATETEVIRLEGEVARAQADLSAAELAVKYNLPVAPFSGVIDRHYVEVGEFVQSGTELMSLVNVERLKATAQIPQQDVGRVEVGQKVKLNLLDGRELDGEVRFISLAANPETRSFYVEVEASNPELWRIAGGSVTLRIQLASVMAHQFSPALLRLGADGELGVHAVDADGQVVNYPVQVVSMTNEGATVEGLPEKVQLITQGAGFVTPGQDVEPVVVENQDTGLETDRTGPLPGAGAME